MPQLTIYKASAGSGKTFRLTVEYLKFLIRRPDSYRSILAVTFTNKATSEMKERILNALFDMMRIDPKLEPTGMAKKLCDELKVTPKVIKEKSTLAMNLLLHDYGHFRVETIDSFFQTVLRNLARELGIGTSMNIELNNSAVLEEAITAMIDKSGKDQALLNWITDYMEEQYQDGKSWKIELALKDFGRNIFSEFFKGKEALLKDKLNDKKFLSNFKKELQALEATSKAKLKDAAGEFFSIIGQHGLGVEDFSYSRSGVCSYFIKLQKGQCDKSITENSYFQAALNDPEKWTSKKNQRKNEITNLAASQLISLIEKVEDLRQKLAPCIITCQLSIKHINKVGLLTDIAKEVNNMNHENNRFLLSDTNALLHSLISGQDASFVYEKIGAEINHILFDEFQDTSRMQWETFRPLLAEGLAKGYKSLIVGDEKQSIYRWRNGDWRILGNIAAEMSFASVKEEVLPNNWRSEQRIVEFNNNIFGNMSELISENHRETFDTESLDIKTAYKDVRQETIKKEPHGYIEIQFPVSENKEDYHNLILQRLLDKIEELQKNGIKPNQIAILIPFNKYIPEIASWFTEHKKKNKDNGICYDIVSDEAFLLSSSNALQILICAMRLLTDPENTLLEAQLKLDYQQDVLSIQDNLDQLFRETVDQNYETYTGQPGIQAEKTGKKTDKLPEAYISHLEDLRQMPIYDLAEELFRIFRLDLIPDQDSFLYAFMDGLNEYMSRNPSDLLSFLEHWDEKLSTKSIPAGTGINGIRIMSIHKSKGLEFQTALVPFCDWKLINQHSEQLWCEPKDEPFNQLDLLPMDFNKSMDESLFKKEYEEETIQRQVDNLNMLYVAFTRAKSNLIVFCQGQQTTKKGSSKLTTVSDLIRESLNNDANYRQAQDEDSEDIYISGSLHIAGENQSEKTENSLIQKGEDLAVPFRSFIQKTKFKQSNKSREFSHGRDLEGFHSTYIDRGKLLHKLFSDIHIKEDIPNAIHNIINEGLASTEDAAKYQAFTEKSLENPEVADWYSGNYKLYNECSILCSGADGHTEMKRPDRVMIATDSVKVVDFKFGKPSSGYKKQILEYMRLLKAMGYPNVHGYLWYVDDERIEEIAD